MTITDDADGPVLAVPPELHLASAARHRMGRQLAAAPDEIVAIVALVEPLGAAASAESHAERRCGVPMADVEPAPSGTFRGAVLARPGTLVDIRAAEVAVEGRVLVDRGAVAHDPWAPVEPTAATPDGRPPFPTAPLVVVLGERDDLGTADLGRAIVNGLVRHRIEARLAVPEAPRGLHLTRPCRPDAGLLDVLDPDVVIALDPDALATAEAWRGGKRGVTLVELSQDTTHDVVLVPWTLGSDAGRLRARVGRLTGVDAIAQLVQRLCAGPQPLPPVDPDPDGTRVPEPLLRHAPTHVSGRSAATARPRSVECEVGPPRGSALAGLLDQLRRSGHQVTVPATQPGRADPGLPPLPRVLRVQVADPGGGPGRRLTVVVLEPDDVLDSGAGIDVAGLCAGGEAIVVPSAAARAVAEATGRPTHVLRPLLATADTVELQRIGTPRGAPVIGWIAGHDDGRYPRHLGSVTPSIRAALDHGSVRLEVTGATDALPLDLRKDERVTLFGGPPDATRLATWTAQVWCPPDDQVRTTGDARALVAAGHAGVPTVVASVDALESGGLPLPELTVDRTHDAAAWTSAVLSLLDPTTRAERSTRCRTVADALAGQWAAEVVVNRLLGWIDRVAQR